MTLRKKAFENKACLHSLQTSLNFFVVCNVPFRPQGTVQFQALSVNIDLCSEKDSI